MRYFFARSKFRPAPVLAGKIRRSDQGNSVPPNQDSQKGIISIAPPLAKNSHNLRSISYVSGAAGGKSPKRVYVQTVDGLRRCISGMFRSRAATDALIYCPTIAHRPLAIEARRAFMLIFAWARSPA